jgi:hypothetical protein
MITLSQDDKQKLNVLLSVLLEMYRVMVSTLLILFVPQRCNDHVCSMSENMVWQGPKYNAGIVVNFLTTASFVGMYYFETKRENKLIAYLEVNESSAFDDATVKKNLTKLSEGRQKLIFYFDKRYQQVGYFAMFMFVFNTILSGFVVYDYYLDNQTTSTFITNILFMLTKLADVYSIVHTERNIFYSAYMKEKLQYNDVDPNKVMTLHDNELVIPSAPFVELVEETKEITQDA